MTPFSALLSDLCHSRRILQKQLAHSLDVDPSYLSALASGRKGAPSDAFLQKLAASLELSDTERQALVESVKISKRKYQVPKKVHPGFYAVAWKMFSVAEHLPEAKLKVINQILEL
jgi:transcriptional regulator with XRE-family HTH domain